jgi:hypothetical protein
METDGKRQVIRWSDQLTLAELADLRDIRWERWVAVHKKAAEDVLASEHRQTLLHQQGNPLALTGRHRKTSTWRSRWKRSSTSRPRHLPRPKTPRHRTAPDRPFAFLERLVAAAS